MEFGVVLQTNPPAWRGRRPGQAGRARTASATCGRSTPTSCGRSRTSSTARSWPTTRKVVVGPMVTNPATRDWTVTAVAVRHPQRDVRQPHRSAASAAATPRCGSPTARPTTLATLRERCTSSASWPTGAAVDYKGSHAALPVGGRAAALEVWVAAYGPKALALTRRGRRRLHPPARRPRHRRPGRSRRSATAPRPPGATRPTVKICVAAPAYVGDDVAHQRDQCRWFGGMVGNHVADIVARYGGEGAAACPRR